MQLTTVIQALRARCPSFANRVAGAAEYKPLPESAALSVPCAFVIPLDDNPSENKSQNVTRQTMTESFAVIVAISNATDERGQAAAHSTDTIRTALWAALLGWSPDEAIYDGITYEGGSLLSLDRARLWYQFEFGAAMEIGPEDGWQETENAALTPFEGVNYQLDAIEPFDPNLEIIGPDGRIEVQFASPPSGDMPQ